MSQFTRRDFLKSTVAVSAVAVSGGALTAAVAKRSATDWVTLGNSGVKVTRLAFGTGTRGGSIQRQLGQDEFTHLVRHAYDRGIRFFETADSYQGMPEMLDNLRGDAQTPGDVPEVTTHVREIHGQGIGVLGMKIMGEGRFTTPEDRAASIKYVMGLGVVDAVTIGYKSPAEIDEAIERIDTHLNA